MKVHMKNLFIINLLVLFLCSGCRTFTEPTLKVYTMDTYVEGYREGKRDGVEVGRLIGFIEGMNWDKEKK